MNIIVNVDANWGIGRDGDLLFPIPEDMRFFRMMTTGKVVVMGRRTLASFPDGRPLKSRTNIVLTRKADTPIEGTIVCHNLGQLAATLEPHPPKDIFVIGGEGIYRQLADCCAIAYVTKVQSAAQADNHFPNLDKKTNWTLAEESKLHHHNGLAFTFCTYQNHKVQPIVPARESPLSRSSF